MNIESELPIKRGLMFQIQEIGYGILKQGFDTKKVQIHPNDYIHVVDMSLTKNELSLFVDQFSKFGLERFIEGHKDILSEKIYSTVLPKTVGLEIRSFPITRPGIVREGHSWPLYLRLFFQYFHGLDSDDFHVLSCYFGEDRSPYISSNVFDSEYFETGYEGHDYKRFDPTILELRAFKRLLRTSHWELNKFVHEGGDRE